MFDIKGAVKLVDKRAFLASGKPGDITVHSVHAPQATAIPSGITSKRHSLSRLAKATTLEELSSLFGSDPILYDPTHTVRRLRGIVRLAAEFRRIGRRQIGRIAFEPRTRTIYVALAPGFVPPQDWHVGRLMFDMAKAARGWQKTGIDCALHVRLCAELPSGSVLVPVDRASIGKRLLARVSTGWRQLLAAVGLVAVGSAPALAQGVEKLNVDTYAGATINSSTEGDLGAKLAMPVIGNLGAQVDLGYGTDDYVGAGGQLFLRDAQVGLFGLSGSAESLDDDVMYRLGAKTEFYLDAITLGGAAGNQWLEGSDGAYGSVDLSLYAGPDFALRGSTEFTPDLNLYRAGVEWRPGFDALPGLSIYADFEHGDDGENAGKVGMLFHFSDDGVTLMDRDRKHNTRSAIFNRKVISYVS